MAPTGALKSTANDMLRFIRLNLNPDDSMIGPALKNALSVHDDSDSDKMGLGWHRQQTVEGVIIWWHNGGTGGYASVLAIDPLHQTGVVVLSNHGDAMAGRFDVDKIGMNLLRLAAKVSLK
jgi:CubicO group peptidase (beta-lactamase class C family)